MTWKQKPFLHPDPADHCEICETRHWSHARICLTCTADTIQNPPPPVKKKYQKQNDGDEQEWSQKVKKPRSAKQKKEHKLYMDKEK